MSQPPEYPGNPSDPQGYPPPPRHGAPPPGGGYGAPPPPPPSYTPAPPPQGPPGGYQAPGGYGGPPPPPPGYGAPSAPPAGYPPPGYGAPAGGPGASFSVGEAFSWAWGKFTKNAAALAVAGVIFVVGLGILFAILYTSLIAGMMNASTTTYDPNTGAYQTDASLGAGSLILGLLLGLLLAVVSFYMQASFISGSLDVADGKPVTVASFLKPRNFGPVLLTALLVMVGTSIGSILCYIPGLIFSFLTMFALQFAVDRSLSPVDSIKASIALTRANVGPSLLTWLVQIAVMLVGEFACGVGLIVAIPVAFLIQTYAYRKLTGGYVAPLEQAGLPPGPPPGQYPGPQYS
ncbi:hypothetical protein Mkiyose1386_06940 [Mycobacterium kiyosense]|uniref:hypothetical protein n=1 Tax=Mycobacterium kiyosense TaxID=2871094 RepID=UPI002171212F|nr:hypothetical protein [Mycobacterium kiyosense]GLD22701.1 hypothetical protein Mkiyose1386_06940 [Mycobacterium kiyosense]